MEERILGECPCPECGHQTHHILRGKPRRLPQLGTPESFAVLIDLRCGACGHEWTVRDTDIKQKE